MDNQSVVNITDILENDMSNIHTANDGLQCITDKMPCCNQDQLGKWLFPDGSAVPEQGNATSFYISRGLNNGRVNLNRLKGSLMPTGNYCCVVPDAVGKENTVCVTVRGNESEVDGNGSK